MSSFDPKFGLGSSDSSQNIPTTSYGSRPSNTLARLAFNIYGSATTNSGSPNSSSTSGRPSPSNSRQQSPTPSETAINTYRSSSPDSSLNQKRYKASYELTSFSLLHNDMQDLSVIAGKNSLQILDMARGKVVNDLLSTNYAMKNKKVIGSILDVSSGYQYNNKYVATSTTTGSILIFNAQLSSQVNKLAYKFSDHSRAVNSVSFSQLDQNLLLSGSQDGQMKLWDLRSNTNKPTLTMIGNADAVRCLKFSPFHNKKFVSIFDSGVIQKWDIRQATQFEKKLNAHTGPGLTLDWNQELDFIVSGGRDRQLQIWNMSSNDSRQIPEHVIYTSSPISKVSFRPNSNLTNISNAEIATSFLNNDLGQAQIYSLKRKYIPLFTIENHSSQITGLNFLNDMTLLSCSKDKFFIMDDLSNYKPTVENLSVASTSWSASNDFIYVNQALQNHSLIEEFEDHSFQNYHPPQGSFGSNSSTSPNNSPFTNQTPSLSSALPSSALMTPVMSMSMQSNNDISQSPRVGISRSSTTQQFRRPTLNKNHSHSSDQFNPRHFISSSQVTQIQKQTHDSQVMNPCVIPVELPINKNKKDLDYFSSNYIFNPKEENKTLIDICEYNSQVALDVGNLRDSQTWKVIKESLVWENSLDEELKYANIAEPMISTAVQDNASFRSDSTSHHGQYSTSNSTNYGGKSPSLSDLSEFNNSSLNSMSRTHSSFSSSFKVSNLKQSILRNNSSEVNVGEVIEEEEDTIQPPSSKDDTLKWDIETEKSMSTSLPSKVTTPKDEETAIEFIESKSIPIINARKIRRGSSLGARSISPTFSIDSTGSGNSQSLFKPLMHRNLQLSPLVGSPIAQLRSVSGSTSPINHSTSPVHHSIKTQKSTISELTRQLTNTLVVDKPESIIIAEDYKIPPYAPNKLINKSIEFSLGQGDLIMSCTLLLLFNGKYKIFTDERFKEIIFTYLIFLQKLTFFIQFSKISIFLNEEFTDLDIDLTTISKTSSSIRHFCSNCNKLITNEQTKAKILLQEKSKKVTTPQLIGTWFCESCLARNKCVYCNEVLKKLSLVKLKCGHNGHFGCLKHWFVELEMEDCPGGCI